MRKLVVLLATAILLTGCGEVSRGNEEIQEPLALNTLLDSIIESATLLHGTLQTLQSVDETPVLGDEHTVFSSEVSHGSVENLPQTVQISITNQDFSTLTWRESDRTMREVLDDFSLVVSGLYEVPRQIAEEIVTNFVRTSAEYITDFVVTETSIFLRAEDYFLLWWERDLMTLSGLHYLQTIREE